MDSVVKTVSGLGKFAMICGFVTVTIPFGILMMLLGVMNPSYIQINHNDQALKVALDYATFKAYPKCYVTSHNDHFKVEKLNTNNAHQQFKVTGHAHKRGPTVKGQVDWYYFEFTISYKQPDKAMRDKMRKDMDLRYEHTRNPKNWLFSEFILKPDADYNGGGPRF